jgi:EAL domain-containing protein (putative c-di-GMP-specific phosphodiesterase class I)
MMEITETARIRDVVKVRESIESMSELDIGIILDDFGSGYNSLGLLMTLPQVRFVKFSMEITRSTCVSDRALGFMQDLCALAQKHGAMVIFEGVENQNEFNRICRVNDELLMQGYYFNKPQPAESVAGSRRLV